MRSVIGDHRIVFARPEVTRDCHQDGTRRSEQELQVFAIHRLDDLVRTAPALL